MADVASRENLALMVYAETLAAFERKNVFMELITKQTIDSGKSAQFIVDTRGEEQTVATSGANGLQSGSGVLDNALNTGVVRTHGLGVDSRTLGSDVNIGERTILVERPKIVRKNVDNFEEKMAHYALRSVVTNQMGSSMANYVDRRVLWELDKAFADAGLTNVQDTAGSVYESAIGAGSTAEEKGDAILDAIFRAVAILDGKDQIGQERYFVTNNENYYNLLQSAKAVNRDFNAGDNGSIATGNVFKIGDVTILRSNNIHNDLAPNITGVAGQGEVVAGYLMTKDVVGMVELMGLQTKQWFDNDYDQTVMKTSLASGYGALNPASLVAITTGTANA